MDAILFIHHLPLSEQTTRKHHALLKALNPDACVIPLKFGPASNQDRDWQRHNCDTLMLEWFDANDPKFDRFMLAEWDLFCTQSIKDFYGPAYNRPAVGATVVKPWSNEQIVGTYGEGQKMRDWHWFRTCDSPELYPFLRGIVPNCGAMFSRPALFSMVQCWKANRPAFDKLQSECRLGTLAAMAGYEPEPIRHDCHEFIHSGDVDFDRGVGLFHRVRI